MSCLVLPTATDMSVRLKLGVKLAPSVVLEQAQVVRQIFEWVGRERATIGEVCRRLQQAGEPTQTGKPVWDLSYCVGDAEKPNL